MNTLNWKLLSEVKSAFMAMPGGEPAAGGGMMTQAQAAPMGGTPQMDPSMAGGDPAAMGAPPMDPAMAAGGAPMDPAMAGGDPAAMGMDPAAMGGAPMDPAMAGGAGGDPAAAGAPPMDPAAMAPPAPAGGQITMTVPEFTQLLQTLMASGGKPAKAPKAAGEGGAAAGGGGDMAGVNQKLDQLITIIGGAMPSGTSAPAPGGAPAPAPAPQQ